MTKHGGSLPYARILVVAAACTHAAQQARRIKALQRFNVYNPMSAVRHDQPAAVWMRAAQEDLATAQYLCDGGRYAYVAFLVHLAIEKALKAVYRTRFEENPPVTHNLRYLADQTDLLIPDDLHDVVDTLNRASILNLYPEAGGATPYSDETATRRLLAQSHRLMDWITDHL